MSIKERVTTKDIQDINFLTHKVAVLTSYRNQSNDLQSKSIDWFLHESNNGT